MDAQEELESYEVTMRNNCGSGYERFLAELSEIGRIEGSMAELIEIGSSEALLQNLSGSVAPCLYDRSHGNQLEDASITNPKPRRHQTRNGPPPDEVGPYTTMNWVRGGGRHHQEQDEQEGNTATGMKWGQPLWNDEESLRQLSEVARLKPGSVMMSPRTGVSVDDDEVDGVGDDKAEVDRHDQYQYEGDGEVGGVDEDTKVWLIPGPQWTTAFGSIYIRTADLLWAAFGRQVVVIQHMHYNERQP
ncbi:uncharacterized protein UHOD_11270 [Ustilago sp. UG-2017b]|nr:uncharacterized protein UHOD_11270 [Ustilago sp. UG-2017b]